MAKFAVLSILVCFIAFYGQNGAVFASVRTSKLNDGPLLDNGEGHQRGQAVEFGPEGRSPHNVPPGLQPADTGVGAVQRGNGAVPAQIGAVPPNFDGVPHGFEKVLPDEVLEKMRQLHRNRKMPIKRKQIEFDRILSAVPSETLAKIPLPPGFESLPESVQSEIRNIHGNSKLNWTQKTEKVHQLVQSLPPEDRPRLPPGDVPSLPSQRSDFFPQNPPPGFEKVIPAPTYQQLLDIHRNPSLSPHEKSRQIDQIMRSLPQAKV